MNCLIGAHSPLDSTLPSPSSISLIFPDRRCRRAARSLALPTPRACPWSVTFFWLSLLGIVCPHSLVSQHASDANRRSAVRSLSASRPQPRSAPRSFVATRSHPQPTTPRLVSINPDLSSHSSQAYWLNRINSLKRPTQHALVLLTSFDSSLNLRYISHALLYL